MSDENEIQKSTAAAPATESSTAAAPADATAATSASSSAAEPQAAAVKRPHRQHRLVRFIVFFLIMGLLLGVTSMIVIPKTNVPKQGIHGSLAWNFYGEPENTIDVAFVGDSDAYNSFSPLQMYRDYGFTSVVCGQSSQHMIQAYDLLQDIFEFQSPKVVVLETDSIFTWEIWPKLEDNNIRLLISHAYPVFEYHDRWKDLTSADFTEEPDYTWRMGTKGYNFDTKVKAYTGGDYMTATDDVAFIDPVARYYLDEIVKLCKDEGATLLLVDTPSAKSWNMSKHNAVQQFADRYGLTFIDMNIADYNPGIDWSKDTYDGGMHMNIYGATKVTGAIGAYLSETFTLPDHRDDSNYTAEWNKALAAYVEDLPTDL